VRDAFELTFLRSISRRGRLKFDQKRIPIPEPIVQLQRRFDEFRRTQPHRAKLSKTLWESAGELAREHGLYPVAHPLRLDYMWLKRRLEGSFRQHR
jgi:hypothetical protein